MLSETLVRLDRVDGLLRRMLCAIIKLRMIGDDVGYDAASNGTSMGN